MLPGLSIILLHVATSSSSAEVCSKADSGGREVRNIPQFRPASLTSVYRQPTTLTCRAASESQQIQMSRRSESQLHVFARQLASTMVSLRCRGVLRRCST